MILLRNILQSESLVGHLVGKTIVLQIINPDETYDILACHFWALA